MSNQWRFRVDGGDHKIILQVFKAKPSSYTYQREAEWQDASVEDFDIIGAMMGRSTSTFEVQGIPTLYSDKGLPKEFFK